VTAEQIQIKDNLRRSPALPRGCWESTLWGVDGAPGRLEFTASTVSDRESCLSTVCGI
jgi:hypothetical protein